MLFYANFIKKKRKQININYTITKLDKIINENTDY